MTWFRTILLKRAVISTATNNHSIASSNKILNICENHIHLLNLLLLTTLISSGETIVRLYGTVNDIKGKTLAISMELAGLFDKISITLHSIETDEYGMGKYLLRR